MTYDTANIFAKILRGEIPCHKVYEDAHCLAFLDIMPRADGHTLVIPKQACCDLLDAPVDALKSVMIATQRIAIAAKTTFGADGVLIEQRSGAAAGQEVFHLHVHIIPRHEGVPLRERKMVGNDVLVPIAERLRAAL